MNKSSKSIEQLVRALKELNQSRNTTSHKVLVSTIYDSNLTNHEKVEILQDLYQENQKLMDYSVECFTRNY